MYELTSFLETIAAASASIVAILGGLIASRLISLNSDRVAAIERMKQINEELKLHQDERDSLQKENDDDDALDFVEAHIEDLISNTELSDLYDKAERPLLQQEKLSQYWEMAREILLQFSSIATEENCQFNSDYIPLPLAQKYADDAFSYGVCQVIGTELERVEEEHKREEKRKNNLLLAAIDNSDLYNSLSSAGVARVAMSHEQYIKNREMIADHNSAIKFLNLEKNQTNNHIYSLKKPKGMKMGLGIFIAFAVVCIICPLAFTPYSTENLFNYHIVKFVFLGLFLIGLATIFAYLVYLLKWNKGDVL